MNTLFIQSMILILILMVGFYIVLRMRNIEIWIVSYWVRKLKSVPQHEGPKHILFSFVDHFEPQWALTDDIEKERRRVDRWCEDYPKLADKHCDADGFAPQHTFYYPEEEYREEHLDKISALCQAGYGEIEIHIHHHDDTAENFSETVLNFANVLHHKHQALTKFPNSGQIAWAFIHGNWALDNSRRDGQFCGINNEIEILAKTGCYADFTLPSAPNETQTSTVNSIYYATNDSTQPKSHDKGVEMSVGGKPVGDLLLIQGPLGFDWENRKFGIIPRIESGDIRTASPPTNARMDNWVKANVHVKNRPEWVFIKVHTHGTQERDVDTLLGKPMDDLFTYMEDKYNDGEKYVLHYVNSREMYNIAKAAEAGKEGSPSDYRDYILPKPADFA